MKLVFCIFFVLGYSTFGCYAQLKPFAFYYSHKNKKTGFSKLKKLPVKAGPYNTLYIHNELIYEPTEDSSARYEVLNDQYVFISFFDSSYRYQEIGFPFWRKGHVMIISIKNATKKYFIDIQKRSRSEGVIGFDESRKLLQIKDLNTNVIIELPAVMW